MIPSEFFRRGTIDMISKPNLHSVSREASSSSDDIHGCRDIKRVCMEQLSSLPMYSCDCLARVGAEA